MACVYSDERTEKGDLGMSARSSWDGGPAPYRAYKKGVTDARTDHFKTSIGGGPAGHPAEGVPTGVALSPTESGDGDSLSTPMSSLGAVSLKGLPNVVWKGSELTDMQLCWSRQSVVSRDVSLPTMGVASGQRSWCPAS